MGGGELNEIGVSIRSHTCYPLFSFSVCYLTFFFFFFWGGGGSFELGVNRG